MFEIMASNNQIGFTSGTILPARIKLSDAQQALLQFLGFLLINLGIVTLPSNEPELVGAIFTFIGFAAILVKAELPSLNPSKLSTSQATFYLALASMLTAINGYIALTYSSYWWAGLIIGIVGALILSIKEIVEGVSPASQTSTSTANTTS
jgi:uncharacterized membrane protein